MCSGETSHPVTKQQVSRLHLEHKESGEVRKDGSREPRARQSTQTASMTSLCPRPLSFRSDLPPHLPFAWRKRLQFGPLLPFPWHGRAAADSHKVRRRFKSVGRRCPTLPSPAERSAARGSAGRASTRTRRQPRAQPAVPHAALAVLSPCPRGFSCHPVPEGDMCSMCQTERRSCVWQRLQLRASRITSTQGSRILSF